MENQIDLYGLVLAGGRSQRMGEDKSLIVYHGKPQRVFLFDMLGVVCDKVFTSRRPGQQVDDELNPIDDVAGVNGPLAGILSAFQSYPDRAWLAVAVDLPNVTADVLRSLVAARDKARCATCFYDSSAGGPEPLLTIWEPVSFPLLRAYADRGMTSPRAFLLNENTTVVQGMLPSVFRNINDPDERRRWFRPA